MVATLTPAAHAGASAATSPRPVARCARSSPTSGSLEKRRRRAGAHRGAGRARADSSDRVAAARAACGWDLTVADERSGELPAPHADGDRDAAGDGTPAAGSCARRSRSGAAWLASSLDHVTKRFGDVDRRRRPDARHRRPRSSSCCSARRAAASRPRLRMIAGLEDPTDGHHPHRRPRRQRRRAQGPRHRDGVPELRALPAHDGAPEHRVPAADAQMPSAEERRTLVDDAARILGLDELLDRKPGAALRRAAPAGRARPGDRAPPGRRS